MLHEKLIKLLDYTIQDKHTSTRKIRKDVKVYGKSIKSNVYDSQNMAK